MADETANDPQIEGADPAADPAPAAVVDEGSPDAVAPAKPEREVRPDWPDDWRDKMAAGDEKLQKRLARFQSPANVLKSYLALEQKVSSGEFKAPPPKDADDATMRAWRAENGIPEAPGGYLENLPGGLVIGDDDKQMIDGFAERMHAQNVPPAVVHEALAWWAAEKEATATKQVEADRAYRVESEDALRAEWGGEFRANINAITNFVKSAPDGVGDLMMQARTPDGRALGDNPAVLRWLMSMSAELNPAGVIAPSDAASQMKTIDGRIAEINTIMREDRKRYDREGLATELQRLYEAQEKVKSRAA